ncbi:tyrosine-protein kinase Btk isoform X6 [Panulirus ornatus]|uniref:tyrosine-protein kinase Btk isoform X6 n=1 Tax=Panulirus ornatus TaxID=150431 RepID=UPI003A8B5A1A
MAGKNEEVLKEAFMTKRSQNKRSFTPTNWKDRWFVLSPENLIYYDGDKQSGRRKERGRVELSRVVAVECVDSAVFQRDWVFQLCYLSDDKEQFVLYIAAVTSQERDQWLDYIRRLVADNECLAERYHHGVFIRSQWTCCKGGKEVTACAAVTWTINHNNNPPGKNGDRRDASGHPTPSPTPPNGSHTDMMPGTPGVGRQFHHHERRRKVVEALYDYDATEAGDLSLRKHDELEVIEDTQEHWWKMKNIQTGHEGFAPSNYVRERGTTSLQQYEWYLGDATRQRAEVLLLQQEREGCFVVRNSTTNSGIYTLSVFSKHLPRSHPQVKHYHIKKDQEGNYYLSHHIKCQTIPDLIYRHQLNPGGLCARLRPPVQGRQAPTTAGLSHDKWEIDPSELNLLEELGSGQFGVVRHGKLRCLDVAVKMMKEGTMSEDEFIEEAKVMTQLKHTNLVQLYGVCSRHRPIYIVTEYLRYGSLLQYLRSNERSLLNNIDILSDMCLQVCAGMAYLENHKFIHRDLAARNCLVGAQNVIKVGDFGLARYVVDDEYTGSGGAKFPIKWAAPEVLNFMRFSSKSDVWAFGVLMWEVFTCGKMPYGRMKNAEVVEMVQNGRVLEQPRFCPDYVYTIMRQCWIPSAEMRPSFSDIARSFPDQ